MRIVFAGTPEFARAAYEALLEAGHEVPAVLTQPDRPAGRGMKLQASAVKQSALLHGAEVLQPFGLKLDGKFAEQAQATKNRLEELAPDVIVVAAYGLILPQWVLDLPRLGCLNIHASLLPRWRGAAPIQRAIEAGDKETGVTIMQMDQGLDTGAMWLSATVPISAKTTAQTLHDELSGLGAKLIVEALHKIPLAELTLTPQPLDGVTYAAKLEKSESGLDFTQPAEQLVRRIRAFDPVPGTSFIFSPLDQVVKVWAAHVTDYSSSAPPGVIVNISLDGIDIATSDGVLRLTELQKAGAKRQTVDVFVRGLNLV